MEKVINSAWIMSNRVIEILPIFVLFLEKFEQMKELL
jgi:hypothetical protein